MSSMSCYVIWHFDTFHQCFYPSNDNKYYWTKAFFKYAFKIKFNLKLTKFSKRVCRCNFEYCKCRWPPMSLTFGQITFSIPACHAHWSLVKLQNSMDELAGFEKKKEKKGSLAKRKTFPDRIKAKFAKELRESRRKRKRKVQKWKTSTYGRRATGIDWKSGMHIGKYEYENRPLESDTEVDGLMPLDGIDLIGVDWEIPSDRQGRLVDGQAIAILRLLWNHCVYVMWEY